MSSVLLAAAVQMTSTEDKRRNFDTARHLIEHAARLSARLVVLPEMFTCLGDPQAMVAAAEPVPGPTTDFLSDMAARLEIVLVGGSIPEESASADRVFNTSLVYGPDGGLLGKYRKMHLFDVDLVEGATYRESAWSACGDEISVVPTPIGRIGQAICYDLRFPELFRALSASQADMFVVPSAFTANTGRDHWEVLLRARAIENQAYLIAADQYGAHTTTMRTHGRSLIVDPWGTIVACASDGEGLAIAEIDLARVEQIRARMPALAHRRM